MKISVVRGNQIICSSSDEQMTMEEVSAIRRKERMTDRKSTLSVSVCDPNKETGNPIKIPQNTAKIIEDAKLVAEGKVPGKTVIIDTMPEEVREAEEKAEVVIEETPVDESSDTVEETVEETPVMTSGYVQVEGDETPSTDDFVTTVANTDEDEEPVEVEETPAEETTTEFNVQSKFTQPVEETPEGDSTETEETEETEVEEEPVEETTTEEIVNTPSASSSSKVIDDFFAKEAREAKMYGNKGNKNFKHQRGNRGGKGRRLEEY